MQNNFLIHFKIPKTILVYKTINYWNLRRAAHNMGIANSGLAIETIAAVILMCCGSGLDE
jgi:hypothetical protein